MEMQEKELYFQSWLNTLLEKLKLTSLNKFDKSFLEFQIIANDNYFNKDKRKFNQ